MTRPHRMLISYHYAKKTDISKVIQENFATQPKVFGDSGAFSAFTVGAKITCEEYAAWVRRHEHLFSVYANLDVIGSAEGSWQNLKKLEAMGIRPLPVYHTGESWEYFDRYCDEYPYIALGGAVGFPATKLMPWAIACFKRARARGCPTVFHGFGLTCMPAIENLPWFSCDSSTWGSAYRFGRIQIYDRIKRKLHSVSMNQPKKMAQITPLIRSYGVDPTPFLDRTKYKPEHAATISALSWRAMEEAWRQRHGRIERADGADEPGFHLYLADGSMIHHATANRALSRSMAEAA